MTSRVQNAADVAPTRPGMKRKLSKLVWSLGTLASALVALVSYRYVAQVGPVPPIVAGNHFLDPWIIVHAGAASTALLLGPLQFLPALRRRWPLGHRWLGRTYVMGCLIGAASALVLSIGTSSGVLAGAGFAALAVSWVYVTGQGFHTARSRQFPEHRRWMIRSFALTFAAVTLRLYMPLATVLGFDPVGAYRAIAWLSWVPNAILAEVYLRRGARNAPVAVLNPSSDKA